MGNMNIDRVNVSCIIEHRVSYENLLVLYMGRVMEMDYSKGFHQLKSSAKPKIKVTKIWRNEMKNLLGGFSWDDADVFDIETNKRNPFSVGITKEGSITLGIAVLNELGYLKENILDADGEPIRKQPAAPSAKEEEDAEKLGSPLKRWNIPEGEILVIRNIKYLDGELLFRIATVKEGYTQIVCPINIQGSGKPQGSYMKLRGISHWHEDNTNANKNATSLRFEEGTGLAVEIDKKTIQLTIAEGEYQENKGVGK